jgi:hypothetical protein
MGHALRTLAVSLVAAFAVAGCGGGDGGGGDSSSPEEWAGGVCSAITDWGKSITATTNSLRGGNLSKEDLSSAVDDFESATTEFVDDLKALGTPDTDAGDKAKESVDQLADDIDESVSKLKSDVADADGGVAAAGAVTATLSTLGSQLSSAFSELEQLDPAGELEDAFRDADSCDELQNAS